MADRPWVAHSARLALSLILLAGIAIAGYLAWHHDNQVYGDATAHLANCAQTETINCDLVNTSRWSELLGVPIAAYAIPTYLLLLALVWAGGSNPRAHAYVFSIGLLVTLASAFLFYISKTEIGFLCLWCMRLYAINLAIFLLTPLVAHRSPRALLRETLADLTAWPRTLRFATAFFAVALLATAAAERGYRHWVTERTAREVERVMSEGGPTVPAVPQNTSGAPESQKDTPATPPRDGASLRLQEQEVRLASMFPFLDAAPAPIPLPAAGPYRLTGPVRRLSRSKAEMEAEPFDLQSRLGKGKPLALLFWAPGYQLSQGALVEWARFLKGSYPQIETYAVAGRRDDQKDEDLLEAFSMMDVPPELPLLVDDAFKISSALDVSDVPNVTLFDAKGVLVVAKMKGREQLLIVPPANVTAEEVVKKVAAGETVATIQRMFPYYPASELYGKCAPPFKLTKFNSTEEYSFTGRSPAKRPTMVLFWSSTCKHCQVEIPHLVAWLKANPGKLDVVSVTYIKADRPGEPSHRKITEAYLKSQGIEWTVLEDPDHAVEELYGSVSTPTAYFVTPDGTVTNAWFYAHEQGFGDALAKELARANAPATAAGACTAPAPQVRPKMDFQVMGADGKRVALASLVDKPAIVHFWATWCKPCVAELPSLLRFRDKFEKTGEGKVILVSVEDEAAGPQIVSFQKTLGADLRSYRAPKGGLAAQVELSYRVPRTYLLARGGTVVASRQGSQNWDDPAVETKIRSRLRNSGP